MANFLQLPVASDLTVTNADIGTPFTNDAVPVGGSVALGGVYAATDNGTVYAANVNGHLAFVAIGMGYKGYTWNHNYFMTVSWEVQSTDWSSIYAIETTLPANYMDTTEFATMEAMTEMFYNEFVEPDYNGVVVSVQGFHKDPNDQGGTSGTGGGGGDFDDTSDPIPIPSTPVLSAANAGLITLFRPSTANMLALGRYLWTNILDFIDNLQKIFVNPMDYVIALNILPCVPEVGPERRIKIGSVTADISMPPILSQWYEHDCGIVILREHWGNALDYAPNTKVQLMLPFIGAVQLNTDEVMNRQIGVKYKIDLLSGACVAMVTVDTNVYYQYTGECAVNIPVTGSDWSRVYSATIGAIGTAIAGGIGVAAAKAGAGSGGLVAAQSYEAAASAGSAWAAINESSKGVKGVAEMRANMLAASREAMANAHNAAQKSGRRAAAVRSMRLANTINNTVSEVMSGKQNVSHSGVISGNAGILGVRVPYLIIEYPNQSLAKNYKHFVGYPANMLARLGDLAGYTECEQVIPEGITGTDDELSEIIEILKGGVYL